ncbi:DUF937 domain-containing protein [Streptomyces sp. ISL-11]|nr:YidB family protein [Streptomyces sp. ISL-11]MBT2384950.1 DUF937 domain-containing protein [Streptomyces sp. ISL-11]
MADNDLGRLLGGLLGDRAHLFGTLLGTLGSDGGSNQLSGLLNQLREGGLGGKVESWVGKGANESVSGPEVAQALPVQALDRVAQQEGVTPEQAADRIADALPGVVDRLTPNGEVPQGSLDDVIKGQ